MTNRGDFLKQMPSTTPRGYVSGLPEGVDMVRRAMRATEVVRDPLGNAIEQPVLDLPDALAVVQRERPDLYRALADFSEDHDNPLEAIAILVGDPLADSDLDSVGTLDGVPMFR